MIARALREARNVIAALALPFATIALIGIGAYAVLRP